MLNGSTHTHTHTHEREVERKGLGEGDKGSIYKKDGGESEG